MGQQENKKADKPDAASFAVFCNDLMNDQKHATGACQDQEDPNQDRGGGVDRELISGGGRIMSHQKGCSQQHKANDRNYDASSSANESHSESPPVSN